MSYTKRFESFGVLQTTKPNPLPSLSESTDQTSLPYSRFPPWIKKRLSRDNNFEKTQNQLRSNRLHSVCEQANCPNLSECFSKKTATFLTLGESCTRQCGFCSIKHDKSPPAPDPLEPAAIVKAARELSLKHIVLTMVARDDLPDGGAQALSAIMNKLQKELPKTSIEVLTTDFNNDPLAIKKILQQKPAVFNHNIETIRRLSPRVRNGISHERSLSALSFIAKHKEDSIKLKSGLMVGLGESEEEVYETLRELKQAGCDIVTIGQYLQPTRKHLLVKRFVEIEEFERYRQYGLKIGITNMYCGPFIRSSYNADLFI